MNEPTEDAEENFTVNCFLTVVETAIIPSKLSYKVYEKHCEIFGVYIVSTNYI